ncbi:MAG: membrane protein insertion efficiency factor YidD [Gemmatimonadota bacterium]|nr:MAG: membrane protein insertion efficiency factor YidD [Gemmatimonadota bacterium]
MGSRIPLFGVVFVTVLVWILSAPPVQAQGKGVTCDSELSLRSKPLVRDINGIPVFYYFESEYQRTDELCVSTVQIIPLVTIHLYKVFVSPFLGARCNFYPSCSEFGFQAYRKYGFLIGTMMTADRLSRDHGFIPFGGYPRDENGRFLDPVEDIYIFKNNRGNHYRK